ncbi:MAG: alanyl-tRNA editing protein [Conexivisphaerales archaeon]
MKLDDIVKDIPPTKLLYLEKPYSKTNETNLLKVVKESGSSYYLIPEKTIFYPKSGGQPNDTGMIISPSFTLNVKKAFKVNDVVVLYGKSSGEPKLGKAEEAIDWDARYLYMRRHAAAHLFDGALKAATGKEYEPTDSWLGDESYVGYKGEMPSEDTVEKVYSIMQDSIKKGLKVSSYIIDNDSSVQLRKFWQNALKNARQIRMVKIEGYDPIPCGGTHVEKLSELKGVRIDRLTTAEQGFRIYFDVL